MTILELTKNDRPRWNAFVAAEFPPVGAFLQSWEWGIFKGNLHGKIARYAILEDTPKKDTSKDVWIGCFQLEIHTLPLRLTYGYAPRGPVINKEVWEDEKKVSEIFRTIADYFHTHAGELIFIRFEPPHQKHFAAYTLAPFRRQSYYLQPRFNQLVPVGTEKDPETILKGMSADIRHDIRAAERLQVTIEDVATLNEQDAMAFERMKDETRARSGKNIFPSNRYFTNFLACFNHEPSKQQFGTQIEPYIRYFVAKKDGAAVAINLNVVFADTLTYLYGASYSGPASKRAPAYLHWKTMHYAANHGLKYYDLGGVDDAASSWQGLSYFKKQFGGETLEYVGTVNVVMRPFLYALYSSAKRCSNYLSTCLKAPAKRK
jgi:lipid II:glycine glycyltransferase (peptidoglycan interpeptide bridge formation enzyme)